MSEAEIPRRPEGGRMRPEGARAVKPRDAATIILVRRDAAKPRVLMGKRNSGHDFMPNLWVFPGGRIDRADFRAPHATDLRPEVAAKFDRHIKLGRGRALALAAIRETFEEAGLLLAKQAPPRPGVGPWRDFLAQGALPDLEAMEIIARAVTPPMLAKRFDTWFLMADAERLISLDRQPDCGELEEIAWVDFDDALGLELPMVTRTMIKEAVLRLDDPERPSPYMRFGVKGHKVAHL
ncbi:NUDIX domain-containing protein [Phenylobacterium sp.]|uniref:NUDIX hydrolase n=1 Tax=Phenylobacterium sp. TaxID=1871053 RepID=UPI002730A84E|nr:NUDIX domain-containing protein [Phenylobacterium sp.]MDP1616502.1 NUDIX domain-containing protein [Phenylobacterium sp.]MDP1987769.1 NUDIX domain-containing protein [Phenylobacterium sp.]